MIKKFIDIENDNTFVFIEADQKLIMWLNGQCEYTVTTIVSIPTTIEESYKICRLNIWYPMEDI